MEVSFTRRIDPASDYVAALVLATIAILIVIALVAAYLTPDDRVAGSVHRRTTTFTMPIIQVSI